MRTGGDWSVYADIAIDAPAKTIHDALIDTERWKDWNTFVSEVEITSHPHAHRGRGHLEMTEGTFMVFHMNMTPDDKMTTKQACAHIGQLRTLENHAPPALTHIRWDLHNATSMLPGFVLKAQRVNEIEDLGDGKSMYRTWESFTGWKASGLKKKYEQILKERFQDWCKDLKKYVEAKQAEGGITPASTVNSLKSPS